MISGAKKTNHIQVCSLISLKIIAFSVITSCGLYSLFVANIYATMTTKMYFLYGTSIASGLAMFSKAPTLPKVGFLFLSCFLGSIFTERIFSGWYYFQVFFIFYFLLLNIPLDQEIARVRDRCVVFIIRFHLTIQYIWLATHRVHYQSWWEGVEIFRVIGSDVFSFLPHGLLEYNVVYISIKFFAKMMFYIESIVPLFLLFPKTTKVSGIILISFHVSLLLVSKIFWWQLTMISILLFLIMISKNIDGENLSNQ